MKLSKLEHAQSAMRFRQQHPPRRGRKRGKLMPTRPCKCGAMQRLTFSGGRIWHCRVCGTDEAANYLKEGQ